MVNYFIEVKSCCFATYIKTSSCSWVFKVVEEMSERRWTCLGREEWFLVLKKHYADLRVLEEKGTWEETLKTNMFCSEEWVCGTKEGVSHVKYGVIEDIEFTELKIINVHSLQWQNEKIRKPPSVGEHTGSQNSHPLLVWVDLVGIFDSEVVLKFHLWDTSWRNTTLIHSRIFVAPLLNNTTVLKVTQMFINRKYINHSIYR